jgi:hypothetical protein
VEWNASQQRKLMRVLCSNGQELGNNGDISGA